MRASLVGRPGFTGDVTGENGGLFNDTAFTLDANHFIGGTRTYTAPGLLIWGKWRRATTWLVVSRSPLYCCALRRATTLHVHTRDLSFAVARLSSTAVRFTASPSAAPLHFTYTLGGSSSAVVRCTAAPCAVPLDFPYTIGGSTFRNRPLHCRALRRAIRLSVHTRRLDFRHRPLHCRALRRATRLPVHNWRPVFRRRPLHCRAL
jgi:hypothetical protein